MSVTLDVSHARISLLNDLAPENILRMLVTLDMDHFEISLLKIVAPSKTLCISVTADTSHSPMGPCEPSAQSPTGDTLIHCLTASLSSALDFGAKTGAEVWSYKMSLFIHVVGNLCATLHPINKYAPNLFFLMHYSFDIYCSFIPPSPSTWAVLAASATNTNLELWIARGWK